MSLQVSPIISGDILFWSSGPLLVWSSQSCQSLAPLFSSFLSLSIIQAAVLPSFLWIYSDCFLFYSDVTKVFLNPFPAQVVQCSGFSYLPSGIPHMLFDSRCLLIIFPYLGFVLRWEMVLIGPVYKAFWFATGDLCPGVLVTNEVLLLDPWEASYYGQIICLARLKILAKNCWSLIS